MSHADLSFEDLVRAYLDFRASKRNTPAALEFEQHLERNLYDLFEDLQAGTYKPGPSICFVITRPKPREVWAARARDRVVHHLFHRAVAPRFVRRFIADSCACLEGRGTLYAARRLEAKVRSITRNWTRPAAYLKCDIASFFVSIHKPTLLAMLLARIPEPFWRDLAERIYMHDPRPGVEIRGGSERLALVPPHKSLMHAPADRGLPIGNLSSQFGANVYLDPLDQFVKHRLRARHYIRYVDDIVLLHESSQQLNAWHDEMEAFLPERLKIELNPTKTIRQPVDRGIDFVGQVIAPWRRTIRPRTVADAMHRLQHMPAADVPKSVNSYFGLLRQASRAWRTRARLGKIARGRGFAVDAGLTRVYG
jgi:retron-type reverse transcriptase